MIESANDYKCWFDARESLERFRRLREPATAGVWQEVITRFAECRAEVAGNPALPLHLLELLRQDDDEHVRWRVRTNPRWLDAHPGDREPWRDDPSVPVQIRLTEEERALLRAGLSEWSGPARCTEELAVAMGFTGVSDLVTQGGRICDALAAGLPLSRTDWVRALLATEVVFISNVVGSGWDWETTTGMTDVKTLEHLRGLQRHVVTGGVVGEVFGTLPRRGRIAPRCD